MNYLTIFIFLGVINLTFSQAQEKLIFQDNFDSLDFETWQHEQTMSGGGNSEFQWYVNNRSNTYVKNSTLYIKPTLTQDAIGDWSLHNGDVNIWGGSPADYCTQNGFWGCERNAGASGNVINPIRSGRLRTVSTFSFVYGRVEVRAKLPKGDWIWPAIWLLPSFQEYGGWPASGEIDIMESRGNNASYAAGGNDQFGSTLHWGPYWSLNRWQQTHQGYKHTASLGDDFHIYGLYWNASGLYTYLDSRTNAILKVDYSKVSLYKQGGFDPTIDNPWDGQSNSAPFNKKFHLIFNVAVGGQNGYFPDGQGGKPWSDSDGRAVNAFWNAKSTWFPTWNGEAAAMKIDYVKVWSFDPNTPVSPHSKQ